MIDYREIGRKIRQARLSEKLSTHELGARMGYTHSAILGWENGRRQISIDDLLKVAKITGRDLAFFLGGVGSVPAPHTRLIRQNIAEIMGVKYIPVVGTVRAGKPILAVENIEDQVPVPETLAGKGETLFALRVKGDSMVQAGIGEGDLAIMRQQDHIDYPGQIALVLVNAEEGTLKRVCQSADGRWWLVAENPAYAPIAIVALEEARIMGVYVGLFKQVGIESPMPDFVPPSSSI